MASYAAAISGGASVGPEVTADSEDPALREVVVDASVLLRIEKHCMESLSQMRRNVQVTGQLLGVDSKERLDVTHCFPFPNARAQSSNDHHHDRSGGDDMGDEEAGMEYQMGMMQSLPLINSDAFTVGWYSSSSLGDWVNSNLIDIMLSYQSNPLVTRKSVVLLFDPLLSTLGQVSLRAMRLTQAFLTMAKAQAESESSSGTSGGIDVPQSYTQETLSAHGLTFNDIFEEIPVRLNCTGHTAAFLMQLDPELPTPSFDHLDLSTNRVLERNVELLSAYMDVLKEQQSKFSNYLRYKGQQSRRGDDGKPPNRLESMLATNQLSLFCNQIQDFAKDSFAKMLTLQPSKASTEESS